jgi:hypothetical protein
MLYLMRMLHKSVQRCKAEWRILHKAAEQFRMKLVSTLSDSRRTRRRQVRVMNPRFRIRMSIFKLGNVALYSAVVVMVLAGLCRAQKNL